MSAHVQRGNLLLAEKPSATLSPAEVRRATKESEESVARRRWQHGCVFPRGGNWVGRYREDFMAEDGKRLRRQRSVVLGPVNTLTKRQAIRRLMERLASINQGTHKPEVMVTFEKFVLENWEPNILPTLRAGTVGNYQQVIRTHLLPFFGKTPLPDISRMEVQQFLALKSKELAPRTVLSLRNRLSKIFGDAQSWSYLTDNPARGTRVPAIRDVREKVALTALQVRALLAELAEPYRTMVLLAVLSGLRRGEIFGLRWRYVDFERGLIIVAESNYLGCSRRRLAPLSGSSTLTRWCCRRL
jgi:integrase